MSLIDNRAFSFYAYFLSINAVYKQKKQLLKVALSHINYFNKSLRVNSSLGIFDIR